MVMELAAEARSVTFCLKIPCQEEGNVLFTEFIKACRHGKSCQARIPVLDLVCMPFELTEIALSEKVCGLVNVTCTHCVPTFFFFFSSTLVSIVSKSLTSK